MTYTYVGPELISVVRWTFFDPTDASTAVFEMNPSDGGNEDRKHTIGTSSRRAPGKKTVVVGNANGIREFKFSGTILTETMYNLFDLWFNKDHPIELTDDLGRTFSIYITEFVPKRVHKPYNPWFHTYDVTGILL